MPTGHIKKSSQQAKISIIFGETMNRRGFSEILSLMFLMLFIIMVFPTLLQFLAPNIPIIQQTTGGSSGSGGENNELPPPPEPPPEEPEPPPPSPPPEPTLKYLYFKVRIKFKPEYVNGFGYEKIFYADDPDHIVVTFERSDFVTEPLNWQNITDPYPYENNMHYSPIIIYVWFRISGKPYDVLYAQYEGYDKEWRSIQVVLVFTGYNQTDFPRYVEPHVYIRGRWKSIDWGWYSEGWDPGEGTGDWWHWYKYYENYKV